MELVYKDSYFYNTQEGGKKKRDEKGGERKGKGGQKREGKGASCYTLGLHANTLRFDISSSMYIMLE